MIGWKQSKECIPDDETDQDDELQAIRVRDHPVRSPECYECNSYYINHISPTRELNPQKDLSQSNFMSSRDSVQGNHIFCQSPVTLTDDCFLRVWHPRLDTGA